MSIEIIQQDTINKTIEWVCRYSDLDFGFLPCISMRVKQEKDDNKRGWGMYEYFKMTSAVRKIVNDKKTEYLKKFGIPKYVKMPTHIYHKLRTANMIYEESCHVFHPEMLMGLIVCPTDSIGEIDGIEMF